MADFDQSDGSRLGPFKRNYVYDLPEPRDAPVYSVSEYTFFGLDFESSGVAACPP